MKFCPSCGCKLIEGANFCSGCGLSINLPTYHQEQAAPRSSSFQTYEAKPPSDSVSPKQPVSDIEDIQYRHRQAQRPAHRNMSNAPKEDISRPLLNDPDTPGLVGKWGPSLSFTVAFWWSFLWRAFLVTIGIGLALVIVITLLTIASGRRDLAEPLGTLAGFIAYITGSIIGLKWAMGKSHHGFRISLDK